MVGQSHVQVEWEEYGKGENRPDSRVRCIPNRLGSSMHATEDRRSMVRSGIWHAYQMPRAAGSNLGTEVFCKTQDKNICFVETRQHHSSGVYKQSGGHGVQRAGSSDKGLVGVVPGEEYSLPGRYSEWDSRCGVSDNDRPHRLETESSHIFRRIDSLMGPLEVDLFASRLTAQCPAYFSWRPDPFAQVVQDWTHIRGFANQPWALMGCVLSHTQSQQAQVTNLEDTNMVSSVAGDASS